MLIKNSQFDEEFAIKLAHLLRKGWNTKKIFQEKSFEKGEKIYDPPSSGFFPTKPEWAVVIKHLMTQMMFSQEVTEELVEPRQILELLEASEKFLQLLGGD